jgi:hypothetical protein
MLLKGVTYMSSATSLEIKESTSCFLNHSMSTMSPQHVQMYRVHGEVTYWVLLCVWSVLFCAVKTSNNFSSVFGGMHTWSVISRAQEVGVSKNKMPAIILSSDNRWGNSLIFMLSNALWAREFSKCPSDPPQEGACLLREIPTLWALPYTLFQMG